MARLLRRAPRAALVLAAAVAAGVALATVVSALRGGGDAGTPWRPTASSAYVTPRTHLFGDFLTGVVEVRVDRRAVDPASVSIAAPFAPYGVVGRPVTARTLSGDVVSIRKRFTLACLRVDCRPEEGRRRFTLSPVRVVYRLRDGRTRGTSLALPPVEAASRLSTNDRLRPTFDVGDEPLPPVGYRVAPDTVATALGAGAALLGALGVLLLGMEARRSLRAWHARRRGEATPLERALVLVRRAEHAGEPVERRLALDRLARALDGADVPLVDAVRRAAWAADDPRPGDLGRLADEVEARTGAAA